MLMLDRNVGESVKIGEDISVTVVAITTKKRVTLGFTAPKEVAILRDNAVLKEKTTKNKKGE